MKSQSDKRVVCDGSCNECARCLRLYLLDAEDWRGINVWRTWLGISIVRPNSLSSAVLHSSPGNLHIQTSTGHCNTWTENAGTKHTHQTHSRHYKDSITVVEHALIYRTLWMQWNFICLIFINCGHRHQRVGRSRKDKTSSNLYWPGGFYACKFCLVLQQWWRGHTAWQEGI